MNRARNLFELVEAQYQLRIEQYKKFKILCLIHFAAIFRHEEGMPDLARHALVALYSQLLNLMIM